jgi:predicted nucleic-acid-binding Zn-ribbon protein
MYLVNIQDNSKRAHTTLKAYVNVQEKMYSISNCHNIAKYIEFYLG